MKLSLTIMDDDDNCIAQESLSHMDLNFDVQYIDGVALGLLDNIDGQINMHTIKRLLTEALKKNS